MNIEFQSPMVTINGILYQADLATIGSTFLGYEDHGMGTAYLNFEGPGWIQSNLAVILSRRDEYIQRGLAIGFEFVLRVLDCVGCSNWESLVGKKVYALKCNTSHNIEGILSLDCERFLIFQEVYNMMKNSNES